MPRAVDFVSTEYITTWNEVFSVTAPLMIDGASDIELKRKLVEVFTNRQLDKTKVPIHNAYIRDYSR